MNTTPDTLKTSIVEALHRFIRQRPGLEYGNYGDPQAYRSELRRITRDLNHARTLLRHVELSGVTGSNLVDAASTTRLNIQQVDGEGVRIHYTTGQYFPVEYRAAVARLCASALWDYARDRVMPSAAYAVEWKNERGEWVAARKIYRDAALADFAAKLTREMLQREALTAFETPPPRYGETLVVERYDGLSAGDWLRRHFRREFGRGIASRFFN